MDTTNYLMKDLAQDAGTEHVVVGTSLATTLVMLTARIATLVIVLIFTYKMVSLFVYHHEGSVRSGADERSLTAQDLHHEQDMQHLGAVFGLDTQVHNRADAEPRARLHAARAIDAFEAAFHTRADEPPPRRGHAPTAARINALGQTARLRGAEPANRSRNSRRRSETPYTSISSTTRSSTGAILTVAGDGISIGQQTAGRVHEHVRFGEGGVGSTSARSDITVRRRHEQFVWERGPRQGAGAPARSLRDRLALWMAQS